MRIFQDLWNKDKTEVRSPCFKLTDKNEASQLIASIHKTGDKSYDGFCARYLAMQQQ